MVLKESILFSLDNSGAKKLKCIHLFSGFYKKDAKLGSLLKVSVKKKDPLKKLNKKLYFALLLTNKKITRRKNGHHIKFDKNKVILLSDQKEIIATRILKPLAKEIKFLNYTKILAMSFCLL